jgi:serine/threonine-protein kinase
MGEVWLAEHDTLARPAALKLIRPEVFLQSGREEALARFEREAQATARLTSPHTIELYDYGVTDEGVFFYVMELLDGRDLEHLLSQAGALSPSRAVYLLEQVCHSLRDAHKAGFVHRDVKPANIYVCRKGADFDFVKVLDFGLVKNLSPDEAALTQANGLRGTPDYMAPETVMGGKAEFAADVYAVGCVAYRMLAGRQVFDGPTIPAVLMQHVREEPTPLDVLCPHPVPADLARLIMRCLAKTPQQRPANAGTLLAELRKTRLADAWTQSEAADWWEAYSASSAGLETASTALADASLMRFVQAKTIAQ